MSSINAVEILTCIGLMAISAYLSSAEIALFSLSRAQLRSLKDKFRVVHRNAKRLLSDPGGLLITILVINEVVNISLSTLITGFVAESPRVSEWVGWMPASVPVWVAHSILGTLVTAPLILFVCEITPKVIGARANRLITLLSVRSLGLVYDVLKPVRVVLQHGVRSLATKPDAERSTVLRESEFLQMVEEGHREGAIERGEVDLIKNVFELDDTTIDDLFVPLSRVYTLPASTTIRAALQSMKLNRYSRIPVTQGSRTNIIGILYTKDLLQSRLEAEALDSSIAGLIHKPLVVQSSLRINALFRKLKKQRTHMAIVKSTTGATLGVITMSDVLGALFEDLFPADEEDER